MPDTEETLERIYRTHSLTVYRLALARCGGKEENAKDVYGETFFQLLKYLRKGGDFRDTEHEKAWLIRTTINCSRAVLRTYRSDNAEISEREFAARIAGGSSDVYDAVMRLPEKYRVAIHLYYYEGYHVKELAAILGKSEGTIKSRLARGRDKLKDDLSEGDVFYEIREV
ncbi:MAG: sigma-70 family RNA polymerase sigma factor [Bacteroides sp.]|nr:sigma-70 family RNA polymerase sigma factor [Roseburia sp.]MCM1463294.1 sigma-70 family RNA polymerase sigma factor [Bacteroides sp.]